MSWETQGFGSIYSGNWRGLAELHTFFFLIVKTIYLTNNSENIAGIHLEYFFPCSFTLPISTHILHSPTWRSKLFTEPAAWKLGGVGVMQ